MFKADNGLGMAAAAPAPAAAPGLTQPELSGKPAPRLPEADGELTE